MQIPIYQVDVFAHRPFAGNPAAVCVLDEWPAEPLLQAIAQENNLSETAFLKAGTEAWHLRWFTPACEVRLCGHATLASGYVLAGCMGQTTPLVFDTLSGRLRVDRDGDRWVGRFPAWSPRARGPLAGLEAALGVAVESVAEAGEDLLVRVADAAAVVAVRPDFQALAKLDARGIIVTAPGDDCDFVSRFFAPAVGVSEDPATGSAHCALVPYWARETGRTRFEARQLSARGAKLHCRLDGGSVEVGGCCRLFLEGRITV